MLRIHVFQGLGLRDSAKHKQNEKTVQEGVPGVPLYSPEELQ